MTRPLRIEFPGAVYHVTSRGDHREAIYADDTDRVQFLNVLALGLERFHAEVLAYCLMGNHYHLVLRTRQATLSLLMRHLNGVYTQTFNRRHGLSGHLFQGRFKAILVDTDAYLLQLCQYVELNPVRAGMVEQPGEWPWSSYRAHTGAAEAPAWLDRAGVAAFVLQREPQGSADWRRAARRYAELVQRDDGNLSRSDSSFWAERLRQQIYLGSAEFVERMQSQWGTPQGARALPTRRIDVPKPQRARAKTLAQWMNELPTREAALRAAHVQSGLSMTALAAELGLTVGRVSQLIKRAEGRG